MTPEPDPDPMADFLCGLRYLAWGLGVSLTILGLAFAGMWELTRC